jgi:hypothetical protein
MEERLQCGPGEAAPIEGQETRVASSICGEVLQRVQKQTYDPVEGFLHFLHP